MSRKYWPMGNMDEGAESALRAEEMSSHQQRGQPMSHVKETTLLEYVIAYLQEEESRISGYVSPTIARELLHGWIESALDAYAGGAR